MGNRARGAEGHRETEIHEQRPSTARPEPRNTCAAACLRWAAVFRPGFFPEAGLLGELPRDPTMLSILAALPVPAPPRAATLGVFRDLPRDEAFAAVRSDGR